MKIFYDVDTQHDFIKKDGALSISGAELIMPKLKALTDYATQRGIPKRGSQDRHFEDDAELQASGGIFPPHCMNSTPGQKKIEATRFLNPVYVEHKIGKGKFKEYTPKEIEYLVQSPEVIIEKQSVDVFSNPLASKILAKVEIAVVYGVATDYCVKAAALGMRKQSIRVYIVLDAIQATNPESGEEALKEMYLNGVKRITTKEVLEGKLF